MVGFDRTSMRRAAVLIAASGALLAATGVVAGCRSPWVQAVIVNEQNTPVNVIEVDYPGGSFGVQSIAPHAAFRYRFHLLGTDKVVLTFTDAARQNRKSTGPELEKGQAGTLRIEIEPGDQVQWVPALAAIK